MVKKTNKTKILLGEDDKYINKAYTAGLSEAGFSVTNVFDGEEVLEALEKQIPDILLIDLIMPNKSGFDVLAKIKDDSKFEKLPILVMSNLGQIQDVEKAKSLGAIDYLIKSNHSMSEVVEKVRSHLK